MLLRRLRPVYEVVIRGGGTLKYRGTTTVPSAVLVSKGNVHTTDSWDWIQATDNAYARNENAWISDPFRGSSAE